MNKKLLALLLCTVMSFVLTACGSKVASMSYDDYNLNDYIKVGKYKGLTVKPYKVSVTSDEVKSDIKSTLKNNAENKKLNKSTKLKDGDTVNIDYVGKINGKKFDGGSAEDTDLELGSDSFIDGFEDGLIGKSVGDKVTLDLKFPSDYSNSDVAGKAVAFTVTINSATRSVTPTEEEYVKNTGTYKSVAEYEKAVKKKLKNKKEEEAIEDQKKSLWSDALDDSKVKKYPKREVDAYVEFNSEQLDTMAKKYGTTRAKLIKSQGYDDEADFKKVNKDSSRLRVKQEMMIEWIAAKENITYTKKESKAMLKKLKKQGYDEDSIASSTGRNASDYVHIELLYEKVLDFLLDNAKNEGSAKTY